MVASRLCLSEMPPATHLPEPPLGAHTKSVVQMIVELENAKLKALHKLDIIQKPEQQPD